jgi:ATP-dependent protease HslVU (ClpYQ) ATPase subunit
MSTLPEFMLQHFQIDLNIVDTLTEDNFLQIIGNIFSKVYKNYQWLIFLQNTELFFDENAEIELKVLEYYMNETVELIELMKNYVILKNQEK